MRGCGQVKNFSCLRQLQGRVLLNIFKFLNRNTFHVFSDSSRQFFGYRAIPGWGALGGARRTLKGPLSTPCSSHKARSPPSFNVSLKGLLRAGRPAAPSFRAGGEECHN